MDFETKTYHVGLFTCDSIHPIRVDQRYVRNCAACRHISLGDDNNGEFSSPYVSH